MNGWKGVKLSNAFNLSWNVFDEKFLEKNRKCLWRCHQHYNYRELCKNGKNSVARVHIFEKLHKKRTVREVIRYMIEEPRALMLKRGGLKIEGRYNSRCFLIFWRKQLESSNKVKVKKSLVQARAWGVNYFLKVPQKSSEICKKWVSLNRKDCLHLV